MSSMFFGFHVKVLVEKNCEKSCILFSHPFQPPPHDVLLRQRRKKVKIKFSKNKNKIKMVVGKKLKPTNRQKKKKSDTQCTKAG